MINNINLGPCNKLYSLELLKNNNIYFEENLKYEDAPFVVKALKYANKIGKINDYLTYYVIHENSETTTRDKRMFDILIICEIIIKELNQDIYHDVLTNLIVMILLDYSSQQRYVKNNLQRVKFINKSFKVLNNLDKNWRKCDYVKKINLCSRMIKTNRILLIIYCWLASYKYCK